MEDGTEIPVRRAAELLRMFDEAAAELDEADYAERERLIDAFANRD